MYPQSQFPGEPRRQAQATPGGEGRIARGLRLAKLSWNVVEADWSLLALPFGMLVSSSAAAAAIFGPLAVVAIRDHSTGVLLLGAALAAFPLHLISTFFGVAFVAVLRKRFAGEAATARDGLAFARSRLGAIAGWALLATIVGLAIQALERVRGGAAAARIAGWLLGGAWSLATLFVVPVLASTDLGAVSSARESAQVLRRKWGETFTGATVINAAFGLLFLPIVLVFVIGYTSFSASPAFGAIAIAIAGGLGILVLAAQFAVDGVFRLALYDYATEGVLRGPFSAADLDAGLRPKRRLLGHRR